MLKKIISLIISLLIVISGLILTYNFIPVASKYLGYEIQSDNFLGMTIAHFVLALPTLFFFSWLALVLAPFITNGLFNYAETLSASLSAVPTSDILVIVLGIGIGLVLANLLSSPFAMVPIIGPFLPIVLSLVLSVIGAKLALRKHGDIIAFFSRVPARKQGKTSAVSASIMDGPMGDRLYSANKLLDTSVIIDGRFMDIMAAGFLEGKVVVTNFVLEELQKLSDSADSIKRSKGRRGLDLIQDLQDNYQGQVLVLTAHYEDLTEVDAMLIRLAKETNADIITNDYNLNKIATIQGVKVLNINELANAVKQNVVAGESLNVYLVKEGKEYGQAVAYLEDGTMIVVENAASLIGSVVLVTVSSLLQTSAGRMIFARLK